MPRALLTLVATLLLPPLAAAQTSIEMRLSTAINVSDPVRLADLANITGQDAAALAPIVVEADAGARAGSGRSFEIDVEAVRRALDGAGVKWGRTTLRGSVCTVYLSGIENVVAPKRDARPLDTTPKPVSLAGPATVRTQAARTLARLYDLDPADLRIAFEPRDDEFLKTPVAGRRIEVQPTNAPSSAQIGLRIYLFSADRLLSQRTISVQVLIRRTVVTAARTIERRAEIGEGDISIGEQWLAPSSSSSCTAPQAIGSIARSRISAGEVITPAQVDAPIIVKKGDIVEIHCLAGNVHLKASRARALESGHDGDLVKFKLEGSQHSFTARMSGRGTAVLVLDRSAAAGAATSPQESTR